MGLDNYGESDMAFDAAWTAIDAMVKSLNKELDTEEGNCYNTCGIINVAMFYEAFIIPNENFRETYSDNSVYKLARKTLKKLEKKIKRDSKANWGNDKEGRASKKMHLNAYNRMAASLRSFIG